MPPTHLVIVCCHGVWASGLANGHDESEWLIAGFQTGETSTFIEHIKKGLALIQGDVEAVLVFSGGPTRKETRLSEAQSYLSLALANDCFGIFSSSDETTTSRIILDEQALDSYHNILFSLVAFWRKCGAWPSRMTIISHEFKRERIVDGHCAAIGFPLSKVDFIGIDPPSMIPSADTGNVPKTGAMEGVRQAVDQWTTDPHGIGEVLAGKRVKRNPWGTDQTLFRGDEERQRSAVATRVTSDGGESLVGEAPRPWA